MYDWVSPSGDSSNSKSSSSNAHSKWRWSLPLVCIRHHMNTPPPRRALRSLSWNWMYFVSFFAFSFSMNRKMALPLVTVVSRNTWCSSITLLIEFWRAIFLSIYTIRGWAAVATDASLQSNLSTCVTHASYAQFDATGYSNQNKVSTYIQLLRGPHRISRIHWHRSIRMQRIWINKNNVAISHRECYKLAVRSHLKLRCTRKSEISVWFSSSSYNFFVGFVCEAHALPQSTTVAFISYIRIRNANDRCDDIYIYIFNIFFVNIHQKKKKWK